MGGCVQPAAECADEQHPEIVAHHRRAGDKSGDDAKGGPALQGKTATEMTGQDAQRERAEPHPNTMAVTGRGASPLSGASTEPTMLDVATMIGLLSPASVFATPRTIPLPRARFSSGTNYRR